MKNANTKSRVSSVSKSRASSVSKLRARLLTSWAAVSVLAASLLFIGLLTGCPHNQPSAVDQPPAKPVDPAAILKTDGHGKITGYKCAKEELPSHLVIPAKIGDEEIKEIRSWAFSGCTGLTSVTLTASLTTIGWGAFYGCTGLTSISLPENLTGIGSCAFEGCTGLTSISLPANLSQIGDGAFSGCKGLTSITLPTNLTQIGQRAFFNCTGLTSISLPANLTKIGWDAFYGCTGLTSLTIDSANAKYKTEGNILYNKEGTFLIFAVRGLTSANILDTVTTIGYSAFSGCTGLTSLDLSACTSLTLIGSYAFSGCTGLTSAVFADKNGWKVYDNGSYSGTPTPISSSDLDNAATAAKYLREGTYNGGYCNKYWKKQ